MRMTRFVTALLFLLLSTAEAQGQHPSVGKYVSTNCFSGDAVEILPSSRFRATHWSDVLMYLDPPEAWSFYVGEVGHYRLASDTLWFEAEEILFDTTQIAEELGPNPNWAVSPEQWAPEKLERLNERKQYFVVRTILSKNVLVWPGHQDDFARCQAYLLKKPEELEEPCSAPACIGVLRPVDARQQ